MGGAMNEAPAPACAVCLDTGDLLEPQRLACGHSFCGACIAEHVLTQARQGRRARCPECQQGLGTDDIGTVHGLAAAVSQVDAVSDCSVDAADVPEEARRAFEAYAREVHAKCCPACRAPIVKNGGCNLMTCRCGHRFRWSEAETLVPCRRVHLHPVYFLWGTTCPGASCVAKAKLWSMRLLILGGMAWGLCLLWLHGILAWMASLAAIVISGATACGISCACWPRASGCRRLFLTLALGFPMLCFLWLHPMLVVMVPLVVLSFCLFAFCICWLPVRDVDSLGRCLGHVLLLLMACAAGALVLLVLYFLWLYPAIQQIAVAGVVAVAGRVWGPGLAIPAAVVALALGLVSACPSAVFAYALGVALFRTCAPLVPAAAQACTPLVVAAAPLIACGAAVWMLRLAAQVARQHWARRPRTLWI